MDELIIDQVGVLQRSWKSTPPLHMVVASFAGVETSARESGTVPRSDEGSMKELAAMLGGSM